MADARSERNDNENSKRLDMSNIDILIDEYIDNHTTEESPALKKIERLANLRLTRPRMLSGRQQGQLLKMICQMIRAKNVLEIGTFAGYASIAMAEGLPNEGSVHTIEIDDEMESFIKESLSLSNMGDKVHLYIGSAIEIVPSLVENIDFDLVYIDANKREYIDYYNLVINNLKTGALIIADNTLWDGKVVSDNIKDNDIQTKRIMEFNDMVCNDDRVEQVILPLRDGLSIIRKK